MMIEIARMLTLESCRIAMQPNASGKAWFTVTAQVQCLENHRTEGAIGRCSTMTEPIVRIKLKASQLEALIMERLGDKPDCAGFIQVYVKATRLEPPEETWTHTLVSRRPTVHRSAKETATMNTVLNEMRKEFDLVPD